MKDVLLQRTKNYQTVLVCESLKVPKPRFKRLEGYQRYFHHFPRCNGLHHSVRRISPLSASEHNISAARDREISLQEETRSHVQTLILKICLLLCMSQIRIVLAWLFLSILHSLLLIMLSVRNRIPLLQIVPSNTLSTE